VEKEWDFKGAEAEYKQFIEKHPNNATVYASYADLLAALGRFDEALATTKRAIDFNPQSVDLAMREGWISYLARKPEVSIVGWQKALELTPSSPIIFKGLGDAFEMAGKDREAFDHYQLALTAALAGETVLAVMAKAYESGGLAAYSRKRLELETEEEDRSGDIWTYNRAKLHARVGNWKEALIWLDKAFQEHNNRLIYLKVEPDFEKIRSDPEYLSLMRKVGLPL
jgi:tetratricopeptide (TPR) repeat protein